MSFLPKRSYAFIATILALSFLISIPANANDEVVISFITEDEVEPRLVTTLTVEQLQAAPYGCSLVLPNFENVKATITVPHGKPNPVRSKIDQTDHDPGLELLRFASGYFYSYVYCSNEAIAMIEEKEGILKHDIEQLGVVNLAGIYLTNRLLTGIAKVGLWLLELISLLLGTLLAARKFISHEFVRSGWPFVQGIANLGFVFALLFIAFATTLNLNIAGGVKRLLPRLLLAAILINFSLVIGGVIIDLSRFLMVIIVRALGQVSSIDEIGPSLIEHSKLIKKGFEITNTGSGLLLSGAKDADKGWRFVFLALQATILIWGLVAGMMVIVVGLFIRYVALILLLIISPLAYLAIAIPKADALAAKWWKEFLKYVFYGPIALFILALLASLGSTKATFLEVSADQNNYALAFETAINVAVIAAFCIAAATFGKHLGGLGAASTVNFMKKRGKQIAKAPITHPKTTAAVVGGALTGGIGGVVAGAAAAKLAGVAGTSAKDAGREIKRGTLERLRGSRLAGLIPAKRTAEGALKKGQTSFGQQAGRFITGRTGLSRSEAQNRTNIKNLKESGLGGSTGAAIEIKGAVLNPSDADNPYNNLHRQEIGENISEMQITAVIKHATANNNYDRVATLSRNNFAVNRMTSAHQAAILNMPGNDSTMKEAKTALKKALDEVQSDKWQ